MFSKQTGLKNSGSWFHHPLVIVGRLPPLSCLHWVVHQFLMVLFIGPSFLVEWFVVDQTFSWVGASFQLSALRGALYIYIILRRRRSSTNAPELKIILCYASQVRRRCRYGTYRNTLQRYTMIFGSVLSLGLGLDACQTLFLDVSTAIELDAYAKKRYSNV